MTNGCVGYTLFLLFATHPDGHIRQESKAPSTLIKGLVVGDRLPSTQEPDACDF